MKKIVYCLIAYMAIFLSISSLISWVLSLFTHDFIFLKNTENNAYLYQIFYSLRFLAFTCNILLLYFGIKLVQKKLIFIKYFMYLMLFETLFLLTYLFFGKKIIPNLEIFFNLGMSIHEIILHFKSLYPLWSPVLIFWSLGEKEKREREREKVKK